LKKDWDSARNEVNLSGWRGIRGGKEAERDFRKHWEGKDKQAKPQKIGVPRKGSPKNPKRVKHMHLGRGGPVSVLRQGFRRDLSKARIARENGLPREEKGNRRKKVGLKGRGDWGSLFDREAFPHRKSMRGGANEKANNYKKEGGDSVPTW